MDSAPLVNRVAASSLVTINLEDYFPADEVLVFDLKDYLFREMILREKDFRQALKAHNWSTYADKHVVVTCSADAIVPVWAFMLVAAYATPVAKSVFQGTETAFYEHFYRKTLAETDFSHCTDRPVVIKGCSNRPVPVAAYVALTQVLQSVARSVMYGEPCSTVPVWKRGRS